MLKNRHFARPLLGLACSLALFAPLAATAADAPPRQAKAGAGHAVAPIVWQDWSDAVFAEAKASKRYILLNVAASWCHWCHVMEETTYRDPKVLALIRKHFIPVRVDQDARPDLSRRYEMYGWPATIVLDGDGQDIGKMRGYRESKRFIKQLRAILKDPSPLFTEEDEDLETGFAAASGLAEPLRVELDRRFRVSLDPVVGAHKQVQRFLVREAIEYGLVQAARGDKAVADWVKLTLNNAREIIDPVWGGMYQYSTHSDWKHPHYEKIMESQANAIKLYAMAYNQFGDPTLLQAAEAVRAYMGRFLTSPDGAFYTSQDADLNPGEPSDAFFALSDGERLKRGVPRVDTHLYARENGWMIEALATLYTANADPATLAQATTAARWMMAHRSNPDGSYRHDEVDKAGPYLGDTLAMGRAFLALHLASGEREWLEQARKAAAALPRFAARNGRSYLPTRHDPKSKLTPRPHLDENIDIARFGNLLYRYTGDAQYKAMADVAVRYLSSEKVALRYGLAPGILLAAAEAASDPLHITVVGGKQDERSQALFKAALAQPGVYRRIEWWDKAEGPMANPDVSYPALSKPAAFVCTNNTCSLPLFEAADIPRQLARQP